MVHPGSSASNSRMFFNPRDINTEYMNRAIPNPSLLVNSSLYCPPMPSASSSMLLKTTGLRRSPLERTAGPAPVVGIISVAVRPPPAVQRIVQRASTRASFLTASLTFLDTSNPLSSSAFTTKAFTAAITPHGPPWSWSRPALHAPSSQQNPCCQLLARPCGPTTRPMRSAASAGERAGPGSGSLTVLPDASAGLWNCRGASSDNNAECVYVEPVCGTNWETSNVGASTFWALSRGSLTSLAGWSWGGATLPPCSQGLKSPGAAVRSGTTGAAGMSFSSSSRSSRSPMVNR
mmetsp:Transcript_12499/g.31177  ORF Transcript_12499/g.31177 Transcript_12499/m.31177 type:complete len:291 (+) Transcript_12499:274-1146(+)